RRGRRPRRGPPPGAGRAGARGARLWPGGGGPRLFDRAPGVVGRVVMLDSQPTTIVGVMAGDESLGLNPEMFLPFDEATPAGRAAVVYGGLGRLADGATADAVRAQVQTIVAQRAATHTARPDHLVLLHDL